MEEELTETKTVWEQTARWRQGGRVATETPEEAASTAWSTNTAEEECRAKDRHRLFKILW